MNSKLTILYARLSVEDGPDKESNSITNQRKLLTEYAERGGFAPYLCLADDGKSGANYERPAWQELMAKVDANEVGTIILKSLDRMGRNYLESGILREMFADKGIRLIAVNDGIDTFDHNDDFVPFREIMAEYYVRDTSRKIKSSLQTKGKSGKPLSTKPPYGFCKDPGDKNVWRVDPEAAAVVRRVFDLAVSGNGPFEICRILHDEKVERPSYYQTKRGYVNYSGALDAKDPYVWGSHSVTFMLSRPEYAGHTVNFKSVKPSYKSKKQIQLPPEQWLIFPNTHEAIVPQETWDLAQKCREVVRRTDTVGEANPLTGLIYCADCGKRLYNHRNVHKVSHYTCSGYTQGRQRFEDEHCSPHYVTVEAIHEILLDVIRKTSGYVRGYEDEFIEKVRQSSTLKRGETLKTHTRQIFKNEKRIAELDKLFSNLYEDKVSGALTVERFTLMTENFEREQSELREKNATLQAEIDAFTADSERADKFAAIVRKFTRLEELTPQMILEFVDKIIIHESVWSEQTETERRKGTRNQRIDVYLKYIGDFDAPDIRPPEEIEAERIAEEKLQRKRKQKRESNRRCTERKRAAASAAKETQTGTDTIAPGGQPEPEIAVA
jgi:DNA invertase Pin-like site-specific DNA recombinase